LDMTKIQYLNEYYLVKADLYYHHLSKEKNILSYFKRLER